MATVQDIMLDSLVKAQRAAEQIMNNTERAHAFSELATACAAAIKAVTKADDKPAANAVVEEKAVEEAPKAAPKRRTRKAAATEIVKEEPAAEQETTAAPATEQSKEDKEEVSKPVQEEVIPDPDPIPDEESKEVTTQPPVSESAPVQEAVTIPVPEAAPAPEPVQEETPPTAEEEPPLTDQWTPQAVQAMRPYVEKLQKFINDYGMDPVRAMIYNATDGEISEPNDVTPLNIKLILEYGEACIKRAQQEQQQ